MTKRKKIIVVFLFALFLIITQSVVENAYFIHSSDLTLEQIDQQYHTRFQDYDFSLNTVKSSPFSIIKNPFYYAQMISIPRLRLKLLIRLIADLILRITIQDHPTRIVFMKS